MYPSGSAPIAIPLELDDDELDEDDELDDEELLDEDEELVDEEELLELDAVEFPSPPQATQPKTIAAATIRFRTFVMCKTMEIPRQLNELFPTQSNELIE